MKRNCLHESTKQALRLSKEMKKKSYHIIAKEPFTALTFLTGITRCYFVSLLFSIASSRTFISH